MSAQEPGQPVVDRPLAVLIVDDYEAQRYAMRALLRRAGFEVREAATGKQAFQAADERPDVILLGADLPDFSGIDVCRLIKANRKTALIPVVHISAANTSPEARTRALEAGADACLIHPANEIELVQTIRSVVRAQENWQELPATASRSETRTILCIDDSELGLETRQTFLQQFGYVVLNANSGKRGLEMFAAIPVDAVILDYNMPDMNGEAVAIELRRMNPAIPIVLLSGYPEEIPRPLIDALDAFVAKGQPPNVLLEALRELLGARPAARPSFDAEALDLSRKQVDRVKDFLAKRPRVSGEE